MIPPGSIPVAAATEAVARWQQQVAQQSNGFFDGMGSRLIGSGLILTSVVAFFLYSKKSNRNKTSLNQP